MITERRRFRPTGAAGMVLSQPLALVDRDALVTSLFNKCVHFSVMFQIRPRKPRQKLVYTINVLTFFNL